MNPNEYIRSVHHGGFRSFLAKASALGIQIEILGYPKNYIVKLSYEGKVYFCNNQNVPLSRQLGNFTKNKITTKTLLESVGIRTPQGILIHHVEEILPQLIEKKLRFPLIVKPLASSLAKGVSWNITTQPELVPAVQYALQNSEKKQNTGVLIEEMYEGNEYRVLVLNGRVLSCVEKIPAGVTGDGHTPIKELIHRFNKQRVHGFEIKLDRVARKTLEDAGYTLDTVLPDGFFFKFRNNLNMSDGGRSVDRTSEMSAYLQNICVKATDTLGLSYSGIDLLTNDLHKENASYVIIEVNPKPFYNMHEKPLVEGSGVDVSFALLKHLFPTLTQA